MSVRWHRSERPDEAAAAWLASHLGPGRVFAVPGGTTPGPVLRILRDDGALRHVRLTLVDERHRAPPSQSNTAQLRATLPDATIIGWDVDAPLHQARALLEARIPPIAVALLGMGPDGHVASLFPGMIWTLRGQRILAVERSPKPPPARLSLTLDALEAVEHIALVVRGSAKAEAVRRLHRDDPRLPLTHLRRTVHAFVDGDAGAFLEDVP